MGLRGPKKKKREERRRAMGFPVAPGTSAKFEAAAKRLGRKSPGWLLDDLANALHLDGREPEGSLSPKPPN
jgi:hypothetical protein